ncbi:unnamed protein product [Allacma fusca]|uniref:Uncharacterized protein n=1 Tax=Allacma fusca TaxID=39272 RepID=A0A8J2KK05_9HEXA|nr:unnamed protein product [Allacma fusca]
MSILYVGRPANYHGRPLWEILLNLKNFGVGRLVTRSTFNFRYPETTFYKILHVEPTVIDYKLQEGSDFCNLSWIRDPAILILDL